MFSKKVKTISEDLDIDMQLIAMELDTSAEDLMYVGSNTFQDDLAIRSFGEFCKDLLTNGIEVTSFNDNTVLYEYLDEPVIYHEVLGIQYVLYDNLLTSKIESQINSYRKML